MIKLFFHYWLKDTADSLLAVHIAVLQAGRVLCLSVMKVSNGNWEIHLVYLCFDIMEESHWGGWFIYLKYVNKRPTIGCCKVYSHCEVQLCSVALKMKIKERKTGKQQRASISIFLANCISHIRTNTIGCNIMSLLVHWIISMAGHYSLYHLDV